VDPQFGTSLLHISYTGRPPSLRLAGDVDVTTGPALAEALAVLVRGTGDLHADLSQLEFIDVEGLRAFVTIAQSLREGRSLTLHSPPSHLRHMIELTGWDGIPGLRLSGELGR
jgi:anti-anti-sigma factor